jgi:hypothetical protein
MKHLHGCSYDKNKALYTFNFNKQLYRNDKAKTADESNNHHHTKATSNIWTDCEMKFFESGIKQFGKDFGQIQKHYVCA